MRLPRTAVAAAAAVAVAAGAAFVLTTPGLDASRAPDAPAAVTEPAPSAVPVTEAPAGPVSLEGLDPQQLSAVVYKSPTCGCCQAWVEHLEENGFAVLSRDTVSTAPVRRAHGVPDRLGSCHTALVGGYVIEGHVPADLIVRLLRERPRIAGLAVPGMPMGSPGMEGPYKDEYDVLAFDAQGRTTVFARR